jgi:hypothetical protein
MKLPSLVALAVLALSTPVPASFFAATAAHARAPQRCGEGYYRNVDGRCIRRPTRAPSAPAGATARCRDGTYSFSQHRRGT